MNKVIFSNNTEIPALWVEEAPDYFDGANRRVLTVQVPKSAISMDELDGILSNSSNLAKVRNMNEENGAEDIFDNYQLKMELSLRGVPVGTDEYGSEISEERIVFKLGRLTPIELRLQALGVL